MKKLILLALIPFIISACQTKDISPHQNYRLKNGDVWRISGVLNSKQNLITPADRNLVIYVNGEEVINGLLSKNITGELSGSYKGKTITSVCSSEQRTENWIDVRCMILVDNERTVTLTF